MLYIFIILFIYLLILESLNPIKYCPHTFDVYMYELLQMLQSQYIASHTGPIFMGASWYPDNMIILCPTPRGLQNLCLSRCHDLLSHR